MNQIHSVCVYSASSTKIAPVYFEAAEKLGSLLAKQHIRLINGAGSIGPVSYTHLIRKLPLMATWDVSRKWYRKRSSPAMRVRCV